MKWKDVANSKHDELERLRALSARDLLGVSVGATAAELKAAYRALAKVYHPDAADPFMRSHNEKVMRLLNAAYEVVSSEVERHHD